MNWRLLGRFVLTKNWQYTPPTNYQIFRIKNNFITNKDNQYLKGAISSVFLENQKVNLFDSRRLTWRNEPEIFVFDFPKALGNHRIGLRRLDDTKLIWSVEIEVLEVEMSNLELSISGLSITDIAGLQQALSEKASSNQLNELEAQLLEAIANRQTQISNIDGLQLALNSKADATHQHQINDIDGLQLALDSKLSGGNFASTGDLASAIVQLNQAIQLGDEANASDFEIGFGNLSKLFPVISPQEPNNPYLGQIWQELDAANNLVEIWVRQGTRWVSQNLYSIDYASPTSSLAGNVSYGFPLEAGFDYYFKSFSYHCLYSSGTVDAANYWRALFTTQPMGQTFADSAAIPNNGNLTITKSLNALFSPAPGERLLLMLNKYGAAPGARIGVNLKYRRVRK
jgi:hypothetical protein